MPYFFSNDGSYGDAEDILVVDTSTWTDQDWQDIDEASDLHRLAVAKDIARKNQRQQEISFYSNAYK